MEASPSNSNSGLVFANFNQDFVKRSLAVRFRNMSYDPIRQPRWSLGRTEFNIGPYGNLMKQSSYMYLEQFAQLF